MQDTICDIHGNTPIYENGSPLYYVAGCGNGTVKLQISSRMEVRLQRFGEIKSSII